MKRLIAHALLGIFGWKIRLVSDKKNLDRCVLVVAPHTSNWDFVLGILASWSIGFNAKIIIKDTHTKAWYGALVRALGGMGIDRSRKSNLVEQVSSAFKKQDFCLVITPEGSRSWSKKWKLGFYHIAEKSGVPLVLAYGDFKEKVIEIGKVVGDVHQRSFEEIMQEMQEYFSTVTPKYTEKYNKTIF